MRSFDNNESNLFRQLIYKKTSTDGITQTYLCELMSENITLNKILHRRIYVFFHYYFFVKSADIIT